MSLENLSATDQKILIEFIDKGVAILQDIADLKDGLKDTGKNLAEKWDVKPAVLMGAVTAAHKMSLEQKKTDLDQIETILQYAKRT